MLVPVGTRLCPAGAPCCAAGGNFSRWSQEEVDLVVSEGVWAKKCRLCDNLLHRDLVERSILVYGKWGQFGHLGGARRGLSFA